MAEKLEFAIRGGVGNFHAYANFRHVVAPEERMTATLPQGTLPSLLRMHGAGTPREGSFAHNLCEDLNALVAQAVQHGYNLRCKDERRIKRERKDKRK